MNKWLDNVENLSDERVILYVKGITKRLEKEENPQARALLGERLGVLQVEAEKRGLSYE